MSFALESVTQTSAGAGGVDVIVKGINVGIRRNVKAKKTSCGT